MHLLARPYFYTLANKTLIF